VEPADRIASGRGPEDLRQLLEHSTNVGALDAAYSAQLSGALDLQTLTVADIVDTDRPLTSVACDATAAVLWETSRRTGHLRVLVTDEDRALGVVHVRDALNASPDMSVTSLMRPAQTMPLTALVHQALARMKQTSTQLLVVADEDGRTVGVVGLPDILTRLLPDPATAPAP
jgi:CBS domain containing-hemolysin-like protein